MEIEKAGHLLHTTAASSAANVPFPQGVQEPPPGLGACLPGRQALHWVAPLLAVQPGSQRTHEVAFSPAWKCPLGQAVQKAEKALQRLFEEIGGPGIVFF